jgi:argininosuccinate lyase
MTAGMWGGRFENGPDQVFRTANDSLPIDWRLVSHDIAGSIAWARALQMAGVLTDEEQSGLTDALVKLGTEVEQIKAPPLQSGAEDVHTWVEQRLIESVGDLGKKLHTGRSRNDQVATDLRLWALEFCDTLACTVKELAHTLAKQAEKHCDSPMPAYTHLQPAQPITFGHFCLAYVEMLERDLDRIEDARNRAAVCPLGSAALAGTAYDIDRERLAHDLGFESCSRNSLDAVSDRDFVIETLSVLSILAVHLSRLAEDLIIYSSSEFSLVRLDDGVTSGSSLMPQKRNPDSLEIIRGSCGTIVGAHVSLMVTVKGLPMAYNKDLQFDKKPLFDAADQMMIVLTLAERTISGLQLQTKQAHARADKGFANATDIADMLVAAGVPFRDAHDRVGQLVRIAEKSDVPLERLPSDVLVEVVPELDRNAIRSLTVEKILDARKVKGGTAPASVRAEVISALERLS